MNSASGENASRGGRGGQRGRGKLNGRGRGRGKSGNKSRQSGVQGQGTSSSSVLTFYSKQQLDFEKSSKPEPSGKNHTGRTSISEWLQQVSPTKSSKEVIQFIIEMKDDWKNLVKSGNISKEHFCLIVEVLAEKVCVQELHQHQQQVSVLAPCCTKEFSLQLTKYLQSTCSGNSTFLVSPEKAIGSIYAICNFLVERMHRTAMDFFRGVIRTGKKVTLQSEDTKEYSTKFGDLDSQLDELVKKEIKPEKKQEPEKFDEFRSSALANVDDVTPPDSIKDIDVIPKISELLLNLKPFLRPNKEKGAYKDSNHYIDVQFRLYREDFVEPLRSGIYTFLKDKEAILKQKKMPPGELRLYCNVTVGKTFNDKNGTVQTIKLAEYSYKRVKWDRSMRLKEGSLILLTSKGKPFQTGNTYFGVITGRDVKDLEKGITKVTWEGYHPPKKENAEYLMFESEAYLEAYKYTLETLKVLDLEKFRMKRFIVDASTTVLSPTYLEKPGAVLKLKMAGGFDAHISPKDADWPPPQQFGLDENQFEAFRAAITKEFTIIQGPPGTGKTFLGLKIAEVFLNNANLWRSDQAGCPITVVCYTNHALDQFMEGIYKYYKSARLSVDMVRIGGRCKSEILEPFSFRNVKKNSTARLPRHYWEEVRAAHYAINQAERISKTNTKLKRELASLENLEGILDFKQLSIWDEIEGEYYSHLWKFFSDLNWFGLGVTQLEKSKFSDNEIRGKIRNWFGYVPEGKLSGGAQTHQKLIPYLPDCSISDCEKDLQRINKGPPKEANNVYFPDTSVLDYRGRRKTVLESRKLILTIVFQDQKTFESRLPNVTDLLKQIKRCLVSPSQFLEYRMDTRWALYFAVVNEVRRLLRQKIVDPEKHLFDANRRLKETYQRGDAMLLQMSKVVGLTTTGAAKNYNLLKMMKSKIVIVEEAAEVFEAHIVTCITEHCQQLILIGDHRQLRPNPTVYHLAKDYNLDLSLFERMINNELHCHQLKVQHRMRPQISDLIVGPIYKELEDHPSVNSFPNVKGVTKNVFFITHTEEESRDEDSTSKSNTHEADFLVSLSRHLILQGYDSSKITILTTYVGQMFLLKAAINAKETCNGIRVASVDNFQGEENDIILLSLVRSNERGQIGFLRTDNRICVALSRARHGLYVIGNIGAMTRQSETWRAIMAKLANHDSIGTALELECQIHGTKTLVNSGDSFKSGAPEGGCSLPCGATLACTHKCTQTCHVLNRDHVKHKCNEPCLEQCKNGLHPCIGKCFQKCPPCQNRSEKILNCERRHKMILPCSQSVDDIECSELVEMTLPCGHKETLPCYTDIFDYPCNVKVEKRLSCNHTHIMKCSSDPLGVTCSQSILKSLPCGHTAIERCWKNPEDIFCFAIIAVKLRECGHQIDTECGKRRAPPPCEEPCKIRLPCGHSCVKNCHVMEDPHHSLFKCTKSCGKKCNYGHECATEHHCYKSCPPCKSIITRNLPCGHQADLVCSENIARHECLQNCRSRLACGHPCTNLCFQPCGPCIKLVSKQGPCGHSQNTPCSENAKKENCEALVRLKVAPVCGHKDVPLECKYSDLSEKLKAKYCRKPCGHEFPECGHQCRGTCGTCCQGRIHKKCEEECGRQLVCGHVCEVPCSKVCPPCQKPCMVKCEHSECNMKCGEPCSDCMEKCEWNCPHKRCTQRCGELCDREPCNEPCSKKLRCGHNCVGFCGETCPTLCRVCDKDELTELFLGCEDEEDARFVYLEDCGHTIEANGLDGWISSTGNGQIKAKTCPKCSTPIRNCRRFGNTIKQHLRDVVAVKTKSFGNLKNARRIKNRWIDKLILNRAKMEVIFPEIRECVLQLLCGETQLGQRQQLAMLNDPRVIDELSMKSLDFIAESVETVAESLYAETLTDEAHNSVMMVYQNTFKLMLDRHPLNRQEVGDFNNELDRLDYYKQLMMRRSLPNCKKIYFLTYKKYEKARDIVTSTLPFTEERKKIFLEILKELDEKLKSGLGVSDRERKEVLAAMGLQQGHWYKCPNGHIYVITECGGPMEESKCNECGAKIGGGSHLLLGDNQLATEMDEATTPAWPTALRR